MYKQLLFLLITFPFYFQISGMEKELVPYTNKQNLCLPSLPTDSMNIIILHSNLQSIGRFKQTAQQYNNTINIDLILGDTKSVAYCDLGKDEKYDACTKALKHYEKIYYISDNNAQIFKNLLKHCAQRRKEETEELIKSHVWGLSRRAPCSPYELWMKAIKENEKQ